MTKLFLKLWLLICLASLTSFQIQKFVFDLTVNAQAQSNSNERFRRNYVYIEEVLAPFPQSQWPERFEKLKEKIGSPEVFLGPSRMLRFDDLAKTGQLSPEKMAVIRAQNPVSLDTPNGLGYEVFHTISGTDWVVVLKAPFARQQPMTFVFGLFSPTQFTWLVESSMYGLAVFFWLRLFRRDMLILEKAATRVGEGSFDFDIKMGKGAAMYPLADAMNKMKQRIGALLARTSNSPMPFRMNFVRPLRACGFDMN